MVAQQVKEIADTKDDLVAFTKFSLYGWILKQDGQKFCDIPLGIKRDLSAALETVESNVNEFIVEQQMFILFVRKDDHERLNDCVTELGL